MEPTLQVPAKSRVRITVVVDCDREFVPGWGYDPQDMADAAAARVKDTLMSYNPVTVTAAYQKVGPLVDVIVAKFPKIDSSLARRMIVEGDVSINRHVVYNPAARVVSGDCIGVQYPGRELTQWAAFVEV